MDSLQSRLSRSVGASIFGIDSTGYHCGRIGYPFELFEAIAAYSKHSKRILEIGPGTGLATRVLLDRLKPDRLVAVEADPGLTEYLAATVQSDKLEIVTGKFETVPLPMSFDLVTCAAAFHWLEPKIALARIRQLLNPGGAVAIWWNTYRQPGIGDPFADAVAPLLKGINLPPSEGDNGHYSLDVDLHGKALSEAGFIRFETHHFRRERSLDLGSLERLYASYSYVRALPENARSELLRKIADLARIEFGSRVPNVVLSQLYLASAPDWQQAE